MHNDLLRLARPEIVRMNAYSSARNENNSGSIWLDANESPWDDTRYNRYPEPQPNTLIARLAPIYSVSDKEILITRGSDEGIDLLLRAFCRAGVDNIMICPPTYGMYQVAATIQNAGVIQVPLCKENNFSLDTSAINNKWDKKIKLLFLCSPNNPTGNLLKAQDILWLCTELRGKGIIIVDEAYIEFSDTASLTNQIKQYPNLIVLRTLSKAYGLAGIRCGVTIANKVIIDLLKKIIAPYPISSPIIELVNRELAQHTLPHKIATIKKEKDKLTLFLQTLPYVEKVWKSDANFILFAVADAKKIISVCRDHGIILRDRSKELNLENCLRVSIGTPNENQLLMKVLKDA